MKFGGTPRAREDCHDLQDILPQIVKNPCEQREEGRQSFLRIANDCYFKKNRISIFTIALLIYIRQNVIPCQCHFEVAIALL